MKFLLFVLLSSIGGWLLTRVGRRGKRVGSEPHCPKCDYNLTGAPSPRCSECGFDFSEAGPVLGQLKRRPVLLVAGATCLGLAAAFIYPAFQETRHDLRYKYYSLRPTALVIRDLQGQFLGQAVDELRRRHQGGRLSEAQIKLAVETLVTQLVQELATAQPPSEAMDALAEYLHGGHLTPEQTFMFFRGGSSIPNVYFFGEGKELCFFPRRPLAGRLPFQDFVGHYRLKVLSVDGQAVEGIGVAKLTTGSSGCFHRLQLPMMPKESIRARLEIDWYDPLDKRLYEKIAGLPPEEQLSRFLPELRSGRFLCTTVVEVTVTARDKWIRRVEPKEIAASRPSPSS